MKWITLIALTVAHTLIVSADQLNAQESNKEGNKSQPDHPIIIIPGDGGSRLQAKLDRKDVAFEYCERKSADWFEFWLNMRLLLPMAFNCWTENMKLSYNKTTRKTQNADGVSIRVKGFGEIESVEYVDASRLMGTSYFDIIVKKLVDLGYKRNKNLFGAPYDFRLAPNEMEEYFVELKGLIELAYETNGQEPVVIICHSMGCQNTLHFLQTSAQSWKNKYIRSLIALAGSWGGTVKALKAFASGDNFGAIIVPTLGLRKDVRTFPSLAFELPSPDVFPDDQVLLTNQKKRYTVKDYQQFFIDLNYTVGYEMWLDVKDLATPRVAPGVEVHCLHGNKVSTEEMIDYPVSNFPDSKPRVVYGDGDGTINLISLEACIGWATQQEQPLYYKNFPFVDHMKIVSDSKILDHISEILSRLSQD